MGSIIQSGGSDASLAEANAESKSLLQLFTHLPILPAAVLTEPEGEIELG